MDASTAPPGLPRPRQPHRIAPEAFAERARRIEAEVGKVIVGQQELVRHTLVGLLANSHVLLEGVPGPRQDDARPHDRATSSTARSTAIQFTPDLMPADITGTNILIEEGGAAGLPVPAGPDLRQPRPRRRDQPRDPQDPVEPARGDAGAPGHGRPQPLPARPAVLRPRDPEPARDGGHLSPPRGAARPVPAQGHGPVPVRGGPHLDHRSHDGRRRPARPARPPPPPRSSRCSGSRGRSRSPRTSPRTRSRSSRPPTPTTGAPRRLVRQYVRYGGSPRGAQALVTAGKILALMDGRFNVSVDDVRAAALPALRHRVILNFEGEAEGISYRGRRPLDPGRGGAARRRVADPAPSAMTASPTPPAEPPDEAVAPPTRPTAGPVTPARPGGVKAFLPERARSDRLRRGVPAPAGAARRAHEAARPGRAQGRPAEREARPVGRVRRLPRLHAGRRPAPARLERLRAAREAVREAVHRGGGRHDHLPRRRQPVDGVRAAREAAVREARRRRARLHRPRVARTGSSSAALHRADRAPAGRPPRLGAGVPAAGQPVGRSSRPRARPTSSLARATPRRCCRAAGSWSCSPTCSTRAPTA